jgi:hypothetical protein
VSDRYIDVTEEQLHKLHDGLEMLEMLDRDAMEAFDLHLYGITKDPSVLDAAREVIADDAEGEMSEEDVQLSEIAVAIPLGADTVYAFGGSGIKLKNESFAYMESAQGIRTGYFLSANWRPTVALSQFSQLALASSDSWLDDFFRQYGNKEPAEIKQNVRRSEEATQPGVPAPAPVPPAPAPEPTETAAPAPPPATPPPAIPKQTSLHGGLKLVDVLEDFLGH